MTWCNADQSTTTTAASQDETGVHNPFQIIPVHHDWSQENTSRVDDGGGDVVGTVTCPSCGHHIQVRAHEEQVRILQDLPGLPAGVKFDPTDQEILEHLEAKVELDSGRLHPLIDEFIPTIEGENGICYTHPEKLPGVNKDGQIRHFFHRPSKAYTTGTRKRRKVHTTSITTTSTTAEAEGDGSPTGETRWHKTGKTRPIFIGSAVKGFKKILVLYTNYGRQRKPEKTNWVMHQYHGGHNEEEKEGELVASKVFFQTQPRQCGGSSSNVKEPEILAPGKPRSPVENISATSFTEFYNIPVAAPPQPTPLPLPFSYDLGGYGDGSSFIHLPSGASKGK